MIVLKLVKFLRRKYVFECLRNLIPAKISEFTVNDYLQIEGQRMNQLCLERKAGFTL